MYYSTIHSFELYLAYIFNDIYLGVLIDLKAHLVYFNPEKSPVEVRCMDNQPFHSIIDSVETD